jgi:hypothetical protein
MLADSGIDYGVQRAIVVTRFAVLDFHRALSGAHQQSDEVDNVLQIRSKEVKQMWWDVRHEHQPIVRDQHFLMSVGPQCFVIS